MGYACLAHWTVHHVLTMWVVACIVTRVSSYHHHRQRWIVRMECGVLHAHTTVQCATTCNTVSTVIRGRTWQPTTPAHNVIVIATTAMRPMAMALTYAHNATLATTWIKVGTASSASRDASCAMGPSCAWCAWLATTKHRHRHRWDVPHVLIIVYFVPMLRHASSVCMDITWAIAHNVWDVQSGVEHAYRRVYALLAHLGTILTHPPLLNSMGRFHRCQYVLDVECPAWHAHQPAPAHHAHPHIIWCRLANVCPAHRTAWSVMHMADVRNVSMDLQCPSI